MQLRVLVATLASVGLFTACGGGSSDSTPTPNPGSGGGTTSTVTLTGVVAGGAALAGASVSVQCATGSGTATASSSGSYSVSITGGALPCVLTGTSGSTSFHSVAPAGTTVANITPLTELLVAQLAGQDPATFASSASASTLGSTVTASAVSAAQTSLQGSLTAAGIDTSAITSFVSTPLVAATSTTTGNTYDQLLDGLNATIASAGTTLAALTTTVAATSAASSTASSGSTSSSEADATSLLPSDLLLAKKASNCATLASGTYRIVKLAPSVTTGANDSVTATETATLNAETLTWTAGADTWTWTANGNCRYSSPDGADIVVAPSGIIVARALIGTDDGSVNAAARGSNRLVLGIPVQQHTVSEFAGTWNGLEAWQDSTGLASDAPTVVIDANGVVTSATCGDQVTGSTSCTTQTSSLPTISANSGGGFDLVSTGTDAWRVRLFLFRSGTGDLMGLALGADGSWFVIGKQRTLTLPAVNDTSANWSLLANVGGIAQAVTANSHKIASVDSTAGSYTRTTTDQSTGVSAPQTLVQNAPRAGYTHRLGASVTASDGSTQTVREGWFLGLKNMGLTAIYLPNTSTGTNSNARFGLSVKQP